MGWTIEINERSLPTQRRLSEVWIRRVLTTVIKHLCYTEGRLSVAFVTKPVMQELNRIYRGKDRPTDVLAFPYEPVGAASAQDLYWGEIVICPAMAKQNIPEFGLPYKQEIARLLIHGTLHLAGYDHVREKDAKVMFGLTDRLLKKLRQ